MFRLSDPPAGRPGRDCSAICLELARPGRSSCQFGGPAKRPVAESHRQPQPNEGWEEKAQSRTAPEDG